MLNHCQYSGSFANWKVLGGYFNENTTHKTLYAGPDPAEPSRVLIRKLIRVSKKTYACEETRITRVEGKNPTVHSQFYRL